MGHVRRALLGGGSGVFGRDGLISLSLGIVVVTQYWLKQVQARGEQRRAREQQEEDHHAGSHGDLVDHHGAEGEQWAPCVDEQDRLALVVALLDQAMVDVALVGLTHVDLNYPEHVVGIPAEEMKAKLDAHDLKLNGTALAFAAILSMGTWATRIPRSLERRLSFAMRPAITVAPAAAIP